MKLIYWSNLFVFLTSMCIHLFDADKPWFILSLIVSCMLIWFADDREEKLNGRIKKLEEKIEKIEKVREFE